MPAKITKLQNGKYRVSTPNGVRAKETTLEKARRQKDILDAYEEKERKKGAAIAPLKRKRS